MLPFFTGTAVHDARATGDSFDQAAGHARCGSHLLREFTAVTDTGTDPDKTRAQQATGAKFLAENEDWYRKVGTLEALTSAFRGNPWIPETG